MITAMTRSQLRERYATIQAMIAKERRTREAVLSHSPALPAKLAECDAALTALSELGNALAALLPPEGPVAIQETLFDAPGERIRNY